MKKVGEGPLTQRMIMWDKYIQIQILWNIVNYKASNINDNNSNNDDNNSNNSNNKKDNCTTTNNNVFSFERGRLITTSMGLESNTTIEEHEQGVNENNRIQNATLKEKIKE